MNRRRLAIGGTVAVVAALTAGAIYVSGLARIASAYKAKTLCSETWLAGRDRGAVLAGEFDGISPALDAAGARFDDKRKMVSASLFGLGPASAVYRDGLGCTIVAGGAPAAADAPAGEIEPQSWPEAKAGSTGALTRIDYAAMEKAIAAAFDDEAARTRSLLVIVDGQLVAERHAPGFLSWSMAKSVTATLVGAAAQDGLIEIEAQAPVPEWQGRDDPRAAITWNDLLRMQSGLSFEEIYEDPSSDVSRMLFRARETGAVAAANDQIAAPGERWYYSSGTSNLVARLLARRLADAETDIQSFARERLFAPIGAGSFTMEVDSAGNPVGSSYMYATARDWARLGQLYLNGGEWNGARLLPEGWSEYVSSPTKASDGEYGAHFWLNRDGAAGRTRWVPGLPEEVYSMAGHEGQYVFIIPDRNMVVVRTGMTRGRVPIEVVGPTLAALRDAVAAQ